MRPRRHRPASSARALRAAQPADLCAHRRGAGRGRAACIWQASSGRAVAALGGAVDLHRGRRSPTSSTAISRARGASSRRFGRMLDPIADKLLVASCLLMLAADGHHPRLVAVGGDRDPVPRNPGVGPARISRRAARQRAGDAARQMEDHAAARRGRLPASRARPATPIVPVVDADSASRCLWLSALLTLYTGWDYSCRRAALHHPRSTE